jgi:hypothetical protein
LTCLPTNSSLSSLMQIHFVSTYNGDDVKIVALFSKANLPEKEGGKRRF